MNKEYKTFEELKEELGDKFEEFMYKSNIELLEKVNQLERNIKEVSDNIRNSRFMIGRTNERSLYATFLSKQIEILERR